ncbi:MAG: hypothetical protein HY064_16990 [Bacteroidetes bacterium]|nr:hypothetical protein [Bacteroidota bacterium]
MRKLIPFLVIIAAVIMSCGSDRLDVDVSAIKVPPVKIIRYEKEFFSLDTAHLQTGLAALHNKYGVFSDGFINNVIYRSGPDSVDHDKDLRFFLSDYAYRDLYKQTNELFKNGFSDLESQLTDAFAHFKYHFPKRKLPQGVYTDMSGVDYNVLYIEGGYIGIGLEYYLGPQNAAYEELEWPAYKKIHCTKEYMLSNIVEGWMLCEFPYDPPKNDVLNKMVYEGKILYLEKALMRNSPDSIILGYSQKQIEWCLANEAMMYSSLIDKQKLYSENDDDLQHYTEDAPFTPDFPRESPGKVGNWIGLRIVESFMNKNPGVSLDELMNIKDAQSILNRAKYKPKF